MKGLQRNWLYIFEGINKRYGLEISKGLQGNGLHIFEGINEKYGLEISKGIKKDTK